ncbi:uncharacterized protein MYCFIDRAFT_157184 [Pseudocercospora fijiensis CIRAD86]|uniref:Peptidase A1 domain-containing protein n=1 Tax=Pseudocercospora fijiensis (strain CIRAD86) TaxID=383855 RepID=M3ALQ9_PSEFD|nr:uncharacterized protein MYCFIDRAFT_157184 [Pseudocercospora fijiensis CIRAD86]EME78392.1 hypothetical protein MYCFIDRAFT_157184 [Pseudocercospora fijiensis CIRAD86]
MGGTMLFILSLGFYSFAISPSVTSASPCSDPTPIALPTTNVHLSNGKSMRGIPASIGTPEQHFSFMIHAYLNDTWAYNSSSPFCFDNSTEAQCLIQRGGFYDPKSSSTFEAKLGVHEAGGDPSDVARAIGTHIWFSDWFTDRFALANTSLEHFPIGMPGFDFGGRFDTQNNIGLGQNSTILKALKNSGRISSRSWSYWYGIESATSSAAKDGQIVFGGYDAAKVTGQNFTQPLGKPSPACLSGMSVIVTGLGLDFPNGTKADLLAGSSFSACFQPDFPEVMNIPSVYWDRLIESTNTVPYDNSSLGVHWFAPTWNPQAVYAGDLTISLSNGFSTTIRNDALVLPDQYVDPSGALVSNSSASTILMAPLENVNSNDVPIIGKEFFSSAYMMVDLDASTYTLWQVNDTTETRLISVGGSCSEHIEINSNDTAPPTATATGAASTGTKVAKSGNAFSAGALVGIVVGSAVGASVIAAVAVLVVMRRRRNKITSATELTPASGQVFDQSRSGPPSYQDHRGHGYGLAEVPAVDAVPYELTGFHKPQELSNRRTMRYELGS